MNQSHYLKLEKKNGLLVCANNIISYLSILDLILYNFLYFHQKTAELKEYSQVINLCHHSVTNSLTLPYIPDDVQLEYSNTAIC